MKGKLLLVTAILLAIAMVGFAQPIPGFQIGFASFQNSALANPANMKTVCGGTEFIPDGTPFDVIDVATGVSAVGAPATYFPYSSYYLTEPLVFNGGSALGMPGNFYTNPCFANDNLPCMDGEDDCDEGTYSPAPSFYLLAYGPCINGFRAKWTSSTWAQATSGPGMRFRQASTWTCVLEACGTPCVPTPAVDFVPEYPNGPQDQGACITLCEGSTTVICVGPVPLPDRVPHVSIMPGCLFPPLGCNDDCTPANIWSLTPFVLTGTGPFYYCATLAYSGEEGCVCAHLDFIEGVETVDLDVAFDGAVRLNWTAASTADIDRYVISRNGSEIGSVASNVYSYVDESFSYGVNYTYELAALDVSGHKTVLATASITPTEGAIVVTEYALHQNFPNPFNPTTTIRFDLVEKNFVSLKVFNATGQTVATMSGEFGAGVNFHNFDASNLTSGLYFYTVQIGDVYSATKKMLLVK
jgi:hypothetical protein